MRRLTFESENGTVSGNNRNKREKSWGHSSGKTLSTPQFSEARQTECERARNELVGEQSLAECFKKLIKLGPEGSDQTSESKRSAGDE